MATSGFHGFTIEEKNLKPRFGATTVEAHSDGSEILWFFGAKNRTLEVCIFRGLFCDTCWKWATTTEDKCDDTKVLRFCSAQN